MLGVLAFTALGPYLAVAHTLLGSVCHNPTAVRNCLGGFKILMMLRPRLQRVPLTWPEVRLKQGWIDILFDPVLTRIGKSCLLRFLHCTVPRDL